MDMQPDKGARAEEILRNYFRELGYFAVRGVKVRIDGTDVTDVDLWLYNRPSPLTRERINVDVKNKRSPQALERVFWAKGVQSVLGFDSCIVATSDKRREVVEFGRQHDVTVLDGSFLAKLSEKPIRRYLPDEDFHALSDRFRESKAIASWYERASECSSVLALKLGYDGCNYLVPEIQFFLEQSMANEVRKEEAIRYTYLLLSYFLISLDFSLAETAFLAAEDRQKVLEDGLRFGRAGRAGTEKVLDLAIRLAVASVPGANANVIHQALRDTSEKYAVQILAEYFSRNQVSSMLFSMAKDFNNIAFEREFRPPSALANGMRSTLFVFLDFLGIERRSFVERTGSGTSQPSLWDNLDKTT